MICHLVAAVQRGSLIKWWQGNIVGLRAFVIDEGSTSVDEMIGDGLTWRDIVYIFWIYFLIKDFLTVLVVPFTNVFPWWGQYIFWGHPYCKGSSRFLKAPYLPYLHMAFWTDCREKEALVSQHWGMVACSKGRGLAAPNVEKHVIFLNINIIFIYLYIYIYFLFTWKVPQWLQL